MSTTARALVEAYRSGRRTPRELAERALSAIEALERGPLPLRAFVHVDPDDVRARADASTARWREGRPLGPLDGVLVAVKDEYDVAGQPTGCGTAFLGREPARADARSVARLAQAGAVLLGKTNMHELGMGPSGFNPHHGPARNPHDPARDPGGSSSGSAVAVAAGLVPIALGTDSGGSLRVPGSLCGVASLKGTFGRISTRGVASPFRSMLACGALGASVADVLSAWAAMAGEPAALPALPRRLRIGVCEGAWREAGGEVASAGRRALERLLSRGAVEQPVELPHRALALPLGFAVLGGEAAAALEPHLAAGAPFGPSVRLALDLARGISASQRLRALRVRALVARELDRALERADVLVTPTTAVTAPRYPSGARSGAVDEAMARALTAFTLPANLAGLPAAHVPCGHDGRGLPIGLQIVARRGDDLVALAVAAEVERDVAWRRPKVWVDLFD